MAPWARTMWKARARPYWPLVCILFAIAVLSHDAAMAGNAQSLGAPLQNEAVALFVPASPADLQCDLDLDASLVSVQYGPASSSLSGASEPHISFPVHTSPADFDGAPPLSAGVRRALLQVFLI